MNPIKVAKKEREGKSNKGGEFDQSTLYAQIPFAQLIHAF
jgi:hypothetical protein